MFEMETLCTYVIVCLEFLDIVAVDWRANERNTELMNDFCSISTRCLTYAMRI